MSDEAVQRELRRLRAQLADTRELASLGLHVALAAVGGARTALQVLQDMSLSEDAQRALQDANGLLDRSVEKLERFVASEPTDAE